MSGKRANGEHSIYQSGDRWHVQGWIGNKRVRVSAMKRSDALDKWRSRMANAVMTPSPSQALMDEATLRSMTVAQLLDQWFELNEHKWSYSTCRGYRHDIDEKIKPYLGEVMVSDVNVARVEHWLNGLQSRGCAYSSIRQARGVLRQAMDMLVRFEVLPANKVSLARNLPKPRAKTDHLTVDEARQVLTAAQNPSQHARWLLALSLGMRSGEVLGLRWDDVDLDGDSPRLVVSGSLQSQSGRGLVRVQPKTRHSVRTLLLAPEQVIALRKVRTEQVAGRLASSSQWNEGNYIFTTAAGTPIDPSNDRKRWHDLLARAGVRNVRRHDARHTAATLLLASGADIARVQKVLGHANISTTVDTYGHLTSEDGAIHTARLAATMCDTPEAEIFFPEGA